MKMRMPILGLLLLVAFGRSCSLAPAESGATKRLPPPERDLNEPAKPGETRTAVFAGGCFWCIEAVFEPLTGVTSVVSGYAGGTAATADYETVSSGRTKHAESVQISYDPAQISYGKLLQVFVNLHHPTQAEGQDPDHGHQYRSAVFYANDQQKEVAQAYIQQLAQAKVFDKPIATTLERLEKFYPAEEYHQDFVRNHPGHPYVRAWALPKIEKLHHLYPELLKPESK